MDAPLRIAVVSTPRAGNTWVRHLLGTAYDVPHLARHAMADADWASTAGGRAPVALGQRRRIRREAERTRFRVVTVARHPLDVLISILHFCVYESDSEHWLLGAGGTEADIFGAMPRSRTFVEYAKGPRAASSWPSPRTGGLNPALSACGTRTWWPTRLAGCGNSKRRSARSDAGRWMRWSRVRAIGRLRRAATNNHFWQGRPGLWRHLLPAAEANEIAAALANLGYAIDPDSHLDALTADRNWVGLVGEETKQALRRADRRTLGGGAEVRAGSPSWKPTRPSWRPGCGPGSRSPARGEGCQTGLEPLGLAATAARQKGPLQRTQRAQSEKAEENQRQS